MELCEHIVCRPRGLEQGVFLLYFQRYGAGTGVLRETTLLEATTFYSAIVQDENVMACRAISWRVEHGYF